MKRIAAITAATAVAAGGVALTIAPAQADSGIERHKTVRCAGNTLAKLELEKEHGRIDIDFELDHAVPNQAWKVRIKHNGKRVLRTTRVTDYEGELDVSRKVPDRRGTDKIVARAKNSAGQVCRVTLKI
ncbi:MAG TPA: hypothetical protein PLT68_12730 [Actinomycetota bacterium]|nr:hypothetical protein [Actinomycetota bacterium]